MNYHVPDIHQDPIPLGQSFDVAGAAAGFFHIFHEVACDRADMACGSSGRDNHIIGEKRFALEVDGDCIYGLVVFQRLLHQFEEFACRLGVRLIKGYYGRSLLYLFPLPRFLLADFMSRFPNCRGRPSMERSRNESPSRG